VKRKYRVSLVDDPRLTDDGEQAVLREETFGWERAGLNERIVPWERPEIVRV
jgi:hypothetical protein